MTEGYETERTFSRDEAATALRRLADGVAGGTVRAAAGDGPVDVSVPTDLTFEVELEESDEDVELEVEREWSAQSDGESAVEAVPDDVATGAADDGSASGAEDDSGPESAAGAQPLESVAGAPPSAAGAPSEAASKARFELFRDRPSEWCWRLVHANGNVIADSGEVYDRKQGAITGLESVKRNASGAVVEEETG